MFTGDSNGSMIPIAISHHLKKHRTATQAK
jgi:hypothetical protein